MGGYVDTFCIALSSEVSDVDVRSIRRRETGCVLNEVDYFRRPDVLFFTGYERLGEGKVREVNNLQVRVSATTGNAGMKFVVAASIMI